MKAAPPFCVDCLHHRLVHDLHTCMVPVVDLVTGTTKPLDLPCGDERSYRNQRPGGCLPAGVNWTNKSPA